MLENLEYFFMVLRCGRSCQEVCGTILRMANKTTEQLHKVSTPCIDDHQLREEELKSVENCQTFVHKLF